MRLFRSLAAALVLLFAATPAFAQQSQKVDGWDIYTNDNNCSAIAVFGGSSTVWLAYTAKNDSATLMLMDDKAFAGVKDAAPYDGKLAFVKGEDIDQQWIGLPMQGAVLDNGAKGVLIRAPSGDKFLKTFSASEFFGILAGDEVAFSIKTGNMVNVISALRACSAKIK